MASFDFDFQVNIHSFICIRTQMYSVPMWSSAIAVFRVGVVCLFALLVLVELAQSGQDLEADRSEGHCRWSGKAPGCGNGTCPGTDWYAIGNSTIDEDGNECADGINNLYCCPKVRKPRPFKVRVCTGTHLQGECVDIEKSDTELVLLPANVKHKANSVDTYGGCVRLYRAYGYGYSLTSVALHRGNSENHTDLSNFNFTNKASSVGPCLRNDFCSPENACLFPLGELWSCCQENTVRSPERSEGPVDYYVLGYKNRTETVFAVFESHHLDTGPQPTSESLEHVRSLGLPTDVVGMLFPARFGGKGTDPRNLFPLTSDPNIQTAFKNYEDIIYDLVRKHGQLIFAANVHYLTPKDTRPTQVVFIVTTGRRLPTVRTVIFLDSIGNPIFPISGSRSLSVAISPAAATFPTTSTQTTTGPFQTTASTDETSEQTDNSTTHWLYYVIPGVLVVSLGVFLMGLCPFMLRKLRARNGNTTGQKSSPLLEQEQEQAPSVRFNNSTVRLD